MTRFTFTHALSLIAVSLIASVLIGHCYELAFLLLQPTWLAAATINTMVAIGVAAYWWRHERRLFALGNRIAYIPALVIICGSLALATITSHGNTTGLTKLDDLYLWATILWIPLVEELVFRCGVSAWLRRWTLPIWAAWFGSLIFAMVHAQPTGDRLLNGQVGLALGAFLLGLACEFLLWWSGSIVPSIVLHAACNATVMIFGVLDPRWLDWLGPLYLG